MKVAGRMPAPRQDMKQVYMLEDLVSRAVLDAGAEKPARLAVIGQPVAHSRSPQMHQAALDALGMDLRYIRLEVEPGRVGEALGRMRDLGFIGCNVTVPHKKEVTGACDEIDETARALGAVNTVKFGETSACGFNTDASGFRRAVEEVLGGPLAGASVMVVGAGGGAGQAIAMSCALAGVRRLVLVNRTVGKLAELAERIRMVVGSGVEIVAVGMDDAGLPGLARSCGVIVQTTSVGLKMGDPAVLAAECLDEGQLVYDTIYEPPLTPLLELARSRGCRVANGESMLLHQGALAFGIWFPGALPLEWMRRGLGMAAL
jgi:shikimate dehydrogenase